jgi:hypothetical protein
VEEVYDHTVLLKNIGKSSPWTPENDSRTNLLALFPEGKLYDYYFVLHKDSMRSASFVPTGPIQSTISPLNVIENCGRKLVDFQLNISRYMDSIQLALNIDEESTGVMLFDVMATYQCWKNFKVPESFARNGKGEPTRPSRIEHKGRADKRLPLRRLQVDNFELGDRIEASSDHGSLQDACAKVELWRSDPVTAQDSERNEGPDSRDAIIRATTPLLLPARGLKRPISESGGSLSSDETACSFKKAKRRRTAR